MAGRSKQPWIVWLRDDLRLTRHAALRYAALRGPVLPVFVIDAASPRRAPGAAARWWLRGSLESLSGRLAERGGQLLIRAGHTAEVLAELAAETDAAGVCALRVYDAAGRAEQDQVEHALRDTLEFSMLPGDLLLEPEKLRTKSGDPYRVFTPFWRALCARIGLQPFAENDTQEITWHRGALRSESSDAVSVPEEQFGWTRGLAQAWQPGEPAAKELLTAFSDDALATYDEDRNLPAVVGTSRLSPHLRFGEISIHEAWDAVAALRSGSSIAPNQCETWLRELGWREFCRHLLFHFPEMETQNFRTQYDAFAWQNDPVALRAWQRGQTGYPLVDAGMRELWHTGWMHNRVRMVVASFLTKHLRIHWREGETWFWDTLVDADYANNPASWQWTAGTGADAAPYFRIFNPTSQAQKFDGDGNYLRHWIPELSELSDKSLHQPWLAPEAELYDAKVILGETYPRPVVDHAKARAAALAANAALK